MKKIYILIILNSLFINVESQTLSKKPVNFIDTPQRLDVDSLTAVKTTFAVIGDYGLSGTHEAAISNLVKSWNPDFIVTLGDNNYYLGESSTIDANIGQYYHNFIYPYLGNYGVGASFNRFFPALGDHDLNTNNGAAFIQYFTLPANERYYDYIKGNIHFFVINSDPREVDGVSSSSIQALWLKNKLENSISKWNVVYFHHSPYSSDAVGSKTYMRWPFKLWGAHVVLSGHSHVYERLSVDGFPYFINGVGGEGLTSFNSPLPESKFRYNSDYGAMLCTEYSDTLMFRFYSRLGTLKDSYLLTKNTTSGDNSPVITITSPSNNTSYQSPANITINATATSSGGSITKVEFYQGTTKIGEDITAPYSFTWMNVTTGNYALKAKATDIISDTGTSQIVNVTVNTCPIAIITSLGPTTFCSGSVTLQSNTGSGFIYQWKKDGVNISGATNSSYAASASGSYQVKIIQGSCMVWSAPISVKILSGLRASITPAGPTTFCSGGNVKLFANTCSGFTYKWKKDGSYISGAASATYIAATAGNYQLQVTLSGVNAWSSPLTIIVNACRESETNQNEETNPDQFISEVIDSINAVQMKVYPNPNTGLFTIELNMAIIHEEKVNMRIVNLLGQEVFKIEYLIKDDHIKEAIELDQSLPTGIYTLQVIIGNKVENTNVVLAR